MSKEKENDFKEIILHSLLNKLLGIHLDELEKRNEDEINSLEYLKNNTREIEKFLDKNVIIENEIKEENDIEINKINLIKSIPRIKIQKSPLKKCLSPKVRHEKNKKSLNKSKIEKKNNIIKIEKENHLKKSKSASTIIKRKKNNSNNNNNNNSNNNNNINNNNINNSNNNNNNINNNNINNSNIYNNNNNNNKNPTIKVITKKKTFDNFITSANLGVVNNNNSIIKKNKSQEKNLRKKQKKISSNLNISKSVKILNKKKMHKIHIESNDTKITNTTFKHYPKVASRIFGEYNFETDEILTNVDFDILNKVKKNKNDYLDVFENYFEFICNYLELKEIYILGKTNKAFFNLSINFLIIYLENSIEDINEEISNLEEIYDGEINFKNCKKNKFQFSTDSINSLNLLNSNSAEESFNISKNNITEDLLFPYKIYFCSIDNYIYKIEDKRECWKKICNYFTKKNKNFKIGTLIEKKLNGKIFSDDFIEKLYNLGENELNKLSSNYYKDIDKTTEIFINIVKDILENIGLSNEKTILIGQKYLILKARLKVKMDKLKKMNEINKKIKK